MRRQPILLIAGTVAVLACGREGLREASPAFVGGPLPRELLRFPFGDGRDGSRTITELVEEDPCVVLQVATGATISIAGTEPLLPGDRLLLWQVQGENVSTVGTTTAGTLVLGSAGLWEIVVVAGSGTTAVLVDPPPIHGYATRGTGRAQACRLKQYRNVTVTPAGRVRARGWDGGSGGVLGFFVFGTLTVEGHLRASDGGFRAGLLTNGGSEANIIDETVGVAGLAGGKGEGIDGTSFGTYGRGNVANAGGGGNGHNAGGGGGGNGGGGGRGGAQWAGFGVNPATAGRPGRRIDASVLERLTFGGGGGAGHENITNGSFGTTGGMGGGVILVFAGTLKGTGLFHSNGNSVNQASCDGAGGGGGGGTIGIFVGSSEFQGVVQAIGGKGGSSACSGNAQGPGGGGGGGRILAAGDAFRGVVFDVDGGLNGLTDGAYPSWYATAGSAGTVEALAELP